MSKIFYLVVLSIVFSLAAGSPPYKDQKRKNPDQCTKDPPKCSDPNEVFILAKYEEATCENQNPTKTCKPVEECRCKDGFVRNAGKCIEPCACSSKCSDPNEEFILAKYSEPSCDNPTPKEITPVQECRCRSGFFRCNGKCVLPRECPPKCKKSFEEYVLASNSEPTCDNPNPVSITPVKECRCIQGRLRANGECVLPIDCPCKANELYVTALFSEPTCKDMIPKPLATPERGCKCVGAYVRENGVCILPADCPVVCNDPNEEYVTAIFSEKTCSDRNQRSIAPVKECRCKNNYLRNGNQCVLPSACPVVCGDPMEEYVDVNMSEPSCGNPTPVPITPTKECRCRAGFFRLDGKCVHPMTCPCSSPNEMFTTTTLSEGTCQDPLSKIIPEVTGCRCKSGMVRNEGVCIPTNDCPPICKQYEEYVFSLFSEPTCNDTVLRSITPAKECRCVFGRVRHEGQCILINQCPVLCKDPFEEYVVTQYSEPTCTETIPKLIVTVQECRCKNGYVRDNGNCILPNTCPVVCPDPNEEFVTALFTEPTCTEPVPCSIPPVQGCRCKSGFVRNKSSGTCIPSNECPVICSDPNAEYVLAQMSEPTCESQIPISITPIKECRCKTGYVKNDGKCILSSECPIKCSDPFEEHVLTYYSEPTCANPVPVYQTTPCKECRCKTGYVRDNGKCILLSTCPVVCNDPMEEYVTTTYGEPTCKDPIPTILLVPVQECRCKIGYVRNDGKCIPQSNCPVICNDPMEEYVTTTYSEPTCKDPIHTVLLVPVQECRCKEGYVRNEGKCILKSVCPVVCNDPMEEYVTTTYSEPTCKDRIPIVLLIPVQECRCKEGYVRCEGKCIPLSECPVVCNDPMEEYVTTTYSEPTCSNPIPSVLLNPVKECRCKTGYFRNDGKCISQSECPVVCSDPMEEYVTASYCEPTCTDPIPKVLSAPVKECRCKSGYLRNDGKCVLQSACPVVCNDPMENFVITTYSEPTCDDPIPKVLLSPVQECRCKTGYVKHEGKCVLQSSCPVVCKDPNEEYITTTYSESTCKDPVPVVLLSPVQECRCKNGYIRHEEKCIPKSECPVICSDPNEEYIITTYSEPTCINIVPTVLLSPVQECRCKIRYVRKDGKCVLPTECPPRCSDPNEEYITTSYSELTCSSPIAVSCDTVTECRCKSGFFRDNGKCIPPSNCPCGPNEFFSLQSPVEPESCDNIGKERCSDTRPGCMCLENYVRDCYNRCIPKCECK